jgi:hypothetical protein
MTSRRPHNQTADHCALVGIDAADISNIVAQWRLANGFRREFVLRRAVAHRREAGGAAREGARTPTERGQDKSRQCAARSGYCFTWAFLPFWQSAPVPRNVRANIKLLLSPSFPHIAGAGDGA